MTAHDVYLSGKHVGWLGEEEGSGGRHYRFQYTDEVVEQAAGLPVLSASLPGRQAEFGAVEARPFFEGLLPELGLREAIARRLKVSDANSFALLGELGRDCAGAVQILRGGEELGEPQGGVTWLSDEELSELVEDLPTRPLGVEADRRGVRLSLAGVQHKAVLIRSPSGAFGVPRADAPSTHVLKPDYEKADAPGLVANEYFCARAAHCAGLPVPEDEVVEIGGRSCLLSRRFDRTTDGQRTIRLHQEDLCQAVGLSPSQKYQETEAGPGFHHLSKIINALSAQPAKDLNTAFRAAVFNFVIGNADAHGKNFALLYAERGPQLAPLYDLVSTAVYDFEPSLAMAIGDTYDPEAVTFADWGDCAYDLGARVSRFDEELVRLAAGYVECAERTRDVARVEGWHHETVDRIVELARDRAGWIDGAVAA